MRHGGAHIGHRHGHCQQIPAPPKPAPTPQGSGLSVAARYSLFALYLHHCGLDLSDPHLRTPHIAAPAPEAWAATAPEEVADYLGRAAAVSTTFPAGRKEHPTPSTSSSIQQSPNLPPS